MRKMLISGLVIIALGVAGCGAAPTEETDKGFKPANEAVFGETEDIDKLYSTFISELEANKDKISEQEFQIFVVLLANAKSQGLTDREEIRLYMMKELDKATNN